MLPYSTPVWFVSGYTHMRQSTWLLVHFLGVSFWSMFRIQRNAWFDSGYNICFSLQSFFEEAHTLSALVAARQWHARLVLLVLVLHAPCFLVWTLFPRPVVSGSHLFYLVFPEKYSSSILWEMLSGYVVFSASRFDSGYMLLPVYVVVGTVSVFSAMLVPQWYTLCVNHGVFCWLRCMFLRGFQALMPCIMPGMDQRDSYVASQLQFILVVVIPVITQRQVDMVLVTKRFPVAGQK